VLSWHQFEIQENLVVNGDHESLTGGNPDLITSWTNNALDAGDTEAEAAIIHSGAQSLEWNPGAVLGEGQYYVITTTSGKYVAFGGWTRGDGTTGFRIGDTDGNQALAQYSTSVYRINTPTTANWLHTGLVLRAIDTNPELQIEANTIAADGFTDDFYGIEANDVTLTATAAIEAGIRIDGRDGAPQTTIGGAALSTKLSATYGDVRFGFTPRHSAANAVAFSETGTSSWICRIYVDADNWVEAYWSAANTITLKTRVATVENTANWDATGLIAAGTKYSGRIKYTSTGAELTVDGPIVASISTAINLGGPPVGVYYGSDSDAANQMDAVFSAP
jgi:hypothetical protein